MNDPVVFTADDVRLLIQLTAQLDPGRYKHAAARALIERCRDVAERRPAVRIETRRSA